jgi:hypothetical protein
MDLVMWGALSDKKSGLYFSVFARHRQRIFLKSESHRPYENILLSLFLRPPPPNLEGQVPVFRSRYLFPPGTG